MQIYRIENRLFMIMETVPGFDFDTQMKALATKPVQEEWQKLMWKYQKALPTAKPGEKWLLMDKIFQL